MLLEHSFDDFINEHSRMFDPSRFSEYILYDLGGYISETDLDPALQKYCDEFNIICHKTDNFMDNLKGFLTVSGAIKLNEE